MVWVKDDVGVIVALETWVPDRDREGEREIEGEWEGLGQGDGEAVDTFEGEVVGVDAEEGEDEKLEV